MQFSNPCFRRKRGWSFVVATRRQLLSQSAELELRDPGIRYAAIHLLTRSDFAPCSYNLRKQG